MAEPIGNSPNQKDTEPRIRPSRLRQIGGAVLTTVVIAAPFVALHEGQSWIEQRRNPGVEAIAPANPAERQLAVATAGLTHKLLEGIEDHKPGYEAYPKVGKLPDGTTTKAVVITFSDGSFQVKQTFRSGTKQDTRHGLNAKQVRTAVPGVDDASAPLVSVQAIDGTTVGSELIEMNAGPAGVEFTAGTVTSASSAKPYEHFTVTDFQDDREQSQHASDAIALIEDALDAAA